MDPGATAWAELPGGGMNVGEVGGRGGVGREGDKDVQPGRSVQFCQSAWTGSSPSARDCTPPHRIHHLQVLRAKS